MSRPTNTERIDELYFRITTQEVFTRERIANLSRDLDRANGELLHSRSIEEALLQRISVLETKSQAYETQSTREWQVWLAIIGAFLALAVNVFRK